MATVKKAQFGRRLKQGDTQGCGMGILRRKKFKAQDGVKLGEPKLPGKSAKSDIKMKKAKSGASLGMKSVKAGYDSNPGVTRADIIVAAKKKAKSGAALKKQAATAIAMKKAGKSPKKMMGGGKCKYGC